MRSVRMIGAGRAGGALAAALATTGRWRVDGILGRADDVAGAAHGVDLLVVATPDATVAVVAGAVRPADAVLAHLSGALGPAPLIDAGHERWAVLHPLVSLPSPEVGAARLLGGAWFGLAADGHPLAAELVTDLAGHAVVVPDDGWAAYHAAAVIASNHLVGLLGQAARVAGSLGIPLAAYLALARGALDNVEALGPAAALTGPVARGDWATVERHLAALPPDERDAYRAGVELCRRLLPP